MSSILPPGSTDFERAMEAAGAARLDAIPTPILEAGRPLEAPAAFLPFLAWGRSGDFYDWRWPEATQRAFGDALYGLHRLKGTEEGIRRHVAYVEGATVVEVVTPPQGFFAAGSYAESRAEWADWAERLPTLRIFPRRDMDSPAGGGLASGGRSGAAVPEMFLGAEAGDEPTWFAGAPELDPWAGEIVAGGAVSAVSARMIADPRPGRVGRAFEIAAPHDAADGFFADDPGGWLLDGAPESGFYRVIAYDPDGAPATSRADALVNLTERVQDVAPMVSGIGETLATFCDDAFEGVFLDAGDGRSDLVLSWALVDGPARVLAGASSLDFDRFGIAPHTAEIVVALGGPVRDAAFFADADFADASAVGRGPDPRAFEALCAAVDAAAALRDDLFIDLDSRRHAFGRARSLADIRF